MRKYETQDEFLDDVEKKWCVSGSPPDAVLQALRGGVQVAETDIREAETPADGSLNLRLSNWILRDEDLPVLETIGVVSTVVTAALAPGLIATAAVLTALSSFATVCWKTWRKGAQLSKDEIAVLGFLQVHGPMDLQELQDKASAAVDDLSKNDVALTLQSLTDVELRDGNIIELVRKDASGRWRARDV